MASGVSQQCDQRGLTHEGGLTTHVRSGDQQHAAVCIQMRRVGDKRFVNERFDHRVTSCFDLDTDLICQLRSAPVVLGCHAGKACQHIKFSYNLGDRAHRLQFVFERVQQLLIESSLPCQRFFARPQHLVFMFLEFRRDIALGALECLTPYIVSGWGALSVGFDIKTMYPVVTYFKRTDAGCLFFSLFQRIEKIRGVAAQRPQLVQLVIVTIGHKTTITQHDGRVLLDRSTQCCGRIQRRAQYLFHWPK